MLARRGRRLIEAKIQVVLLSESFGFPGSTSSGAASEGPQLYACTFHLRQDPALGEGEDPCRAPENLAAGPGLEMLRVPAIRWVRLR
jgi:hypothetical protein